MGIFAQTLQQQTSTTPSTGDPFKVALTVTPKPAPAPKQDYGDKVADQYVAGAKKIAGSVKKGATDIQQGFKPGGNIMQGVKGFAEGAFGTITGAAQTALAPIAPVAKAVEGAVVPAAKTVINKVAPLIPTVGAAKTVYDAIAPKVQALQAKHPESSELINDVLNTALLAVGGGEADLGEAANATKESLSSVPGDLKSTTTDLKNSVINAKPDTAKITDTISPKATPKETKLAETQGRFVKGKQPTLFKNGTIDTITPSKQVVQSAKTISEQIPGAAKMDEPTLYTALDKKVGEIATNLKPQMEATPIKEETLTKLNDSWDSIKKQQISDAPATEEPNVRKRQIQFEENFLKKSGSENLNDLWETAKKYDASIPERVKSANALSNESLQAQRAEWIQNRAIFKTAINDGGSGLGETSRKAFSDMTDMYRAQDGILSKAKVETTPKPSKISQFASSKTAKVLKTGAQIAGGAYAAEKLKGALGF